MARKKTTEEFIEEAKKIHKFKYDYSKTEYKNSKDKVVIICKEHGEFTKAPNKHLSGQGCPKCKGYVKLSQTSFLERAIIKHKDLYDYPKTIVKSKNDKVVVTCKIHGDFEQLPANHLKGSGCPKCAQIKRTEDQRYSKEDFINSVSEKHQHKYDYSESEYLNSQTKIKIICAIHGDFYMKPNSHHSGQGCPQCGRLNANKNIALDYNLFLDRAHKIHKDQYTYDENSYVNYSTRMNIYCNEHRFFSQTPHSHISMKTGCPKCGDIKGGQSNSHSWDVVLNLFKEIHGLKYNYDKTSYVSAAKKMRMECKIHGWFEQRSNLHYSGTGCPKCAVIKVHEQQKIDFNQFKERSIVTHMDRYKYYEEDYIDIFSKTKITCEKHGDFYQKPINHYRGAGCQKCTSSRGENTIRNILDTKKIKYIEQKKFDDLKFKGKLKCDFFLSEYNTVIEYNGIQHYQPVAIFGGIEGLKNTQNRDLIKYKYLNANNIKLIIVKYDVENIKDYIFNKLILN